MKILLITQSFLPYKHSGVFRALAFARYFPESGIEPIVITATERKTYILPYPDSSEQIDMPVIRVPWINKDTGVKEFVLAQVQRFPIGWALVRKCKKLRDAEKVASLVLANEKMAPDIAGVLATSPDPIAIFIGAQISGKIEVPLWVDMRDAWTYGWSARYRSYFDFIMERRMERDILKKASLVIANTALARKQLVELVGVDPGKTIIVHNGYDESEWLHVKSEELSTNKDVFEIAYFGLSSSGEREATLTDRIKKIIGLDYSPVDGSANSRSPIHLLEALRNICDQNAEFSECIRLRWVGPIDDSAKDIFNRFGKYFPIVLEEGKSEKDCNSMMASVDLLILLQVTMYINGKDYCTAIPAKVFNYLRSGTRILAPVQQGDITELLGSFSGTRCTRVGDIDELVSALFDEFMIWKQGQGRLERNSEENKRLKQYDRRTSVIKLANILMGHSE